MGDRPLVQPLREPAPRARCGVADGVFPLRADARALPFADGFFDAIVSIDSFVYYGTDDLYLGDIARLLRPGGVIGIAGAGLVHEIDGEVPERLRAWWEPAMWCLHSAGWWRRHWERTELVAVETADAMEDGWERWLEWQRFASPGNATEIAALEADRGRTLGYVRAVARRTTAPIDPPITSIATEYAPAPLLRDSP